MNCKCFLENRQKNSAKQFTVFVNGSNRQFKRVVINPRKIRKWHHVLEEITEKLDPYFGPVKKLYTSISGITIHSFSDLENNANYVASTNRKMQVVNGGYKLDTGPKRDIFEHYLTGQLKSKNKRNKLAYVRRDLLVIYVFHNGKENDPPCKFVFTQEDLNNWDRSLNYIGLVLDSPDSDIKYLYNSKGHRICGPWELQHGASYVAVGFHEKFVKRNYKIQEDITEIWKDGIPVTGRNATNFYHREDVVKTWKQNLGWKSFENKEITKAASNSELNAKDLKTHCYYYDIDYSSNSLSSLTCNCTGTETTIPTNELLPTNDEKPSEDGNIKRRCMCGKKKHAKPSTKELYKRFKENGRESWHCKCSFQM